MNYEQQYFNQLAERWDDVRAFDPAKLASLVSLAGIQAGDRVLDIGCGTGVLLPFLRQAVGETGTVTALDFAANMIARAAEKHQHLTGITYVAGDIFQFNSSELFDRIVCLNFFPHAQDKPAFLTKLQTLLRTGGTLVIMHDMSRDAVNAIHKTSAEVKNDRLPAGEIVAEMLRQAGYTVTGMMDNSEFYFISAQNAEG